MISKATHRGFSDRTISYINEHKNKNVKNARIGQVYWYNGTLRTLVHITNINPHLTCFAFETKSGYIDNMSEDDFIRCCFLRRKKVERKPKDRSVQYVHLFLDGSSMVTLSKTYRGKKTLVQTFVAGASK